MKSQKSKRSLLTEEARRKFVKQSVWTPPVIFSVSLPAHGTMTPGGGGDPTEGTTTPPPCVIDDLMISFSAPQIIFNSDAGGIQSPSTLVTNNSPVPVSLSATVTPSSKGESYVVSFVPSTLAPGASGTMTVQGDFTGLSTFCTGFDNAQFISVTVSSTVSDDCSTVETNQPAIAISFGC